MKNPIDKILTEWAYRVHNGMPDPSNIYHLIQLDEAMTSLKLPRIFKQSLLNRMRGITEDDGGGGVTTYPDTKTGRAKAKPGERWKSAKGRGKVYIGPGGEVEGEEKGSKTLKPMARENVDAIDGTAKEGGLDGTIKAPGNLSSVINEIGVGVGMGYLSDNPNLTVDELEELLFNEMNATTVGKKNGEEKTRNACRAAAKSARREFERSQETIKNQKDNAKRKMNPEKAEVSHVWGSKDSLQKTVDHLEKLGVTEVNGIPFDPDYKKIILEGGAGENPTDTMVVMVDDSQKPPVCFINHTSNKTSSNDIQGNSSPEKNAQAIREQAKTDLDDGKITQKEYDYVVKRTNKLEDDLKGKQSEIDSLIQEQNDKLRGKLPRKLIDELKVLSTGADKASKWKDVVTSHQKKIEPPLDPPVNKRKFNGDTGEYNPPLTPEEEEKIAESFVTEMEDAANGVDGAAEPAKKMTQILARIVPPPVKELRQLYRDQHKLITDSRNELNENIKSPKAPQPYGDYTASKNFLKRLHVDVVEGHNPGGIPKENFEVSCGNNDSGVVYDRNGNEYVWNSKPQGYFKAPLRKDAKGNVIGGADKQPGIRPREKDGEINPLFEMGDNAVVINEKNLAKCLGVKPPVKDIAEHIRVSDVESSSGVTGNVTIYDLNGNIIGEQAIRPKGGTGTKVQDTVKFHPSFQKCLQRGSKK